MNTTPDLVGTEGSEVPRTSTGYVLVVDDEPEIRRLLQEILEDEHYSVQTAANAQQARALFQGQRPDLVLLDIWMPDTDGITLLKEWSNNGSLDAPVVMMSGHGTIETAVEATRLGAYDFIEKPLSMGKLLVTIERALESEKLKRENQRLRTQSDMSTFLVGRARAIQELRAQMERVAATDSSVLISGEPGSGKAAAARYLHAHSARAHGPYVEVNFAAIPEANRALHLFGSEQGGVVLPGAFEQTHGGVLMLSDVTELDSALQAQLHQALSDQRFTRLGGRESLAFDARVITIATRDLKQAVTDGVLRESLYYRLAVVPLVLPTLREHREDIPELVNTYVNWLVDNEGLAYRRFTTAALNLLRNHGWPGNLRELRNAVQRVMILNQGTEVGEEEVEHTLGHAHASADVREAMRSLFNQPLRDAREQFERAYLEHHLHQTDGNMVDLSRLSGMERTHLYRKLKQLGLSPKPSKG
ncbi:MAG TPA: sigma-54 dependent transcriptional regulator [Burkholderiales bacterium]|nr:sigma-54 dependent transcriptional regulator [Burkholderiales bacterium]